MQALNSASRRGRLRRAILQICTIYFVSVVSYCLALPDATIDSSWSEFLRMFVSKSMIVSCYINVHDQNYLTDGLFFSF